MTTATTDDSADARALTEFLTHHAALCSGVTDRVSAVHDAVRSGTSHKAALAELRGYLAENVLTHAAAEEAVLYPAAGGTAGPLIQAMLVEHGTLADSARRLGETADGVEAVALTAAIAAVFTLHVRKENEILLPTLLHTPGEALPTLLAAMERWLRDDSDARSS